MTATEDTVTADSKTRNLRSPLSMVCFNTVSEKTSTMRPYNVSESGSSAVMTKQKRTKQNAIDSNFDSYDSAAGSVLLGCITAIVYVCF